jgi:hypothetical protein
MKGQHTQVEVVVLSVSDGEDKYDGVDEGCKNVEISNWLSTMHQLPCRLYIRVADAFFPKYLA